MKNRASLAAFLRRSSVHSPHMQGAVCHIFNLPVVNKHHRCITPKWQGPSRYRRDWLPAHTGPGHVLLQPGHRPVWVLDGSRAGSWLGHRTPSRKRRSDPRSYFHPFGPLRIGYDTLAIKLQLFGDALGHQGWRAATPRRLQPRPPGGAAWPGMAGPTGRARLPAGLPCPPALPARPPPGPLSAVRRARRGSPPPWPGCLWLPRRVSSACPGASAERRRRRE